MATRKESKEITPFIRGIRHIIDTEWQSHTEFVEKGGKLTNRVYLSTVLSGQVTLTAKFKNKLAERAGKSAEYIEMIGLELLRREEGATSDLDLSLGPVAEKSSRAIYSAIDTCKQSLRIQVDAHTAALTEAIENLMKERDYLCHILDEERAIMNNVDMTIRVIGKDMTISFCNEATNNQLEQFVGDAYYDSKVLVPKEIDLVQKVFATGDPAQRISFNKDGFININAYPIWGADDVDKVILVTKNISHITSFLEKAGWQPPKNEVIV